jgi:hypothetical protein
MTVETADLATRFERAPTYLEYVAAAQANVDLWRAVYQIARVPDDLAARAAALPADRHLLILSEDWCGDAVNTVPLIARLADAAPRVDLRVLARDQNPDLMDSHLTNGSRSIPVAIVYDASFTEIGCWGPRPRVLQRWVMGEGKALPKDEKYREIRRWYARDRGRSTYEEVLQLLETP